MKVQMQMGLMRGVALTKTEEKPSSQTTKNTNIEIENVDAEEGLEKAVTKSKIL